MQYVIMHYRLHSVANHAPNCIFRRLHTNNVILFITYRALWARAACRRASRSGPVAAAVGLAWSRTGQPTAVSPRTPSGWRRRTATCPRRTSRPPRSALRTVCVRLSNTTCRAKAVT